MACEMEYPAKRDRVSSWLSLPNPELDPHLLTCQTSYPLDLYCQLLRNLYIIVTIDKGHPIMQAYALLEAHRTRKGSATSFHSGLLFYIAHSSYILPLHP